jgi:hypothetical protein
MKLNTPLEELSQGFICPVGFDYNGYWRSRILDDTENNILYIIPAGYTQRDGKGIVRSLYYKSLYNKAVSLKSERRRYPLGENSHKIILKPEPSNPYDQYAVRIGIVFDDKSKTPENFTNQTWKEIGYIPKVISKLITKNIPMLKEGKLTALQANYADRIYFGRIEIPYGSSLVKNYKNCNIQRITDILEG